MSDHKGSNGRRRGERRVAAFGEHVIRVQPAITGP
jgi:hypothetical protein